MKRLTIALAITLLSACAHAATLTEDEAATRAFAYVAKHPDITRLKADCLVLDTTASDWTFDLREKHNAACGGDPQTSPRLATLHVDAVTGKITRDKEAWE